MKRLQTVARWMLRAGHLAGLADSPLKSAVGFAVEKVCPVLNVPAGEEQLQIQDLLPEWLQSFRQEMAEESVEAEPPAPAVKQDTLKKLLKPNRSFSQRAHNVVREKRSEWEQILAKDPSLRGRGCSNASADCGGCIPRRRARTRRTSSGKSPRQRSFAPARMS